MTEEVKNSETNIQAEQVSKEAEAKEVSKLSDAEIKWRVKYKQSKQELEEQKLQNEKQKKEVYEKVANAERTTKMLEDKLLDAELKAHAVAAGLKDLDFVQLIDKSGVKVVEGKIEGIEKAVADFKSRKPDLFGSNKQANTSSGVVHRSNGSATNAPRDAWAYSKDEFRKEKINLTRGKYRG